MKTPTPAPTPPQETDELFRALRPALRLVHLAVRESVRSDRYDEAKALIAVAESPALAQFGPPGSTGSTGGVVRDSAEKAAEQRGRWLVDRVLAAMERVRDTAPPVVSGALGNAGEQALALWSLYVSTGIDLVELPAAQEGVIDPPIGGRDVQQKIESRMWLSARPTGRAADAVRALTLEIHAALRAAGPGRQGGTSAYDDVARAVFAYESRRMEALGRHADLQLLTLLGTLAPDPLPVALLQDDGWRALPAPLRETAKSPALLGLLIRRLVERGLLHYQNGTVDLASSIRDEAAAGLTSAQIRRWTDTAVRFLTTALPPDTHYHLAWPAWKGVTNHLHVVLARAEELGVRIGEVVNLLDRYSVLLRTQGQDEDAIAVSEHAVRLCEPAGVVTDELHGTVLGNLALALSLKSRRSAADRMREALAFTEAAFGRDHHEYAESLNIHADILGRLGRYKEADEVHREAVAVCRELLRENGEEAMADITREALNDFAASLLRREPRTGRTAEARARQALALLDEADALGEHAEYGTAQITLNRAGATRRLGDLVTARRLLEQVVEICDAEIEEPSYLLFGALVDLAEVLEELGDAEGAAHALNRAHAVDDGLAALNDSEDDGEDGEDGADREEDRGDDMGTDESADD